jgi:hypothetical protein
MSLSQIFEGWKNHLAPAEFLKEQIVTVASERMKICRQCPLNSIHAGPVNQLRFDEHCTKCHCTLSAKTACLSCSCPDDKWTAVVTQEEEQKIEKDERV